jgi:ABC-2 type transport system ATP-binding protein
VPAVVAADHVTKHWGATVALDGATFEIATGVTGLLGANGAGKTTALGLILGLERPDGGTLEVLGRDPWTAGPDVRALIGYAPEHNALPPDVSAQDLVRHLAEVHGLPYRDATARASDALYEVGLGEERFRPVGTMSTGQRQRVKLAQAIVHDPALVLLDEPTDGLDPMQRDEMLNLIHRIGSELGLNVVLSSHLLHEVERVCDAVVILEQGRTVGGGKLTDLQGMGDNLVVELDGDAAAPGRLEQRLHEMGVAAVAEGRLVYVALEAPVVFDYVRDALVETGAAVRRMERRTRSLEDVYLAAGHES